MYKPWFPQRNMLDTPIAVLKNFIFYLNVPISRYTIEMASKEHPDYPNLSSISFTSILDGWGIKTLTVEWSVDRIKELPSPSLLFINEKNGNAALDFFVMMFEISGDEIEYLHPRKGWIIEKLSEFDTKWSKAALVVTNIVDTNWEPGFEEKEETYEKEKLENSGMKNVMLRHDFLTEEECEYVINLANPIFQPSKLMTDDGLKEFYRTSFSAELVIPEDEILNGIRKKAAEWLDVPESHFEFFQCVAYGPGQEYQTHYDTFDENFESGKEELEKLGPRKYTMLAYLNDDFVGGETYFPNLDLLVQPKKGSVLVFENIDENGKIQKSSLHAGLPVTSGKKYAMNMWIRTKPARD
jgi:prolyl 4-hydroxylase